MFTDSLFAQCLAHIETPGMVCVQELSQLITTVGCVYPNGQTNFII